ncbi:hypothetical protein [Flavobacterium sp. UBA7682]|uniref:hypothetical protein n=1 Tax=Flavobacterium sp. UBA7682 TaxID=1946560 RepID=UPI0025BF0A07|nr:hypothetical protein [Flavobacterium sp. UBA7682]
MKTNFLNILKQGLFLLIAVLGTFISYAQPTQTTTIGGSKTPDVGALQDIGGKQRPEPMPVTNLNVETQCMFAYFDEIGGPGGKGTSNDIGQTGFPDDLDNSDIGGRSTSGDPGHIVNSDLYDGDTGLLFDIGGRSTGGEPFAFDIGGRNSAGGGCIFDGCCLIYIPE